MRILSSRPCGRDHGSEYERTSRTQGKNLIERRRRNVISAVVCANRSRIKVSVIISGHVARKG
jgi:hypothetical protein